MAKRFRTTAALTLALTLPLAAGLESTPATAGVPVLGASLSSPLGAPAWQQLSPDQQRILAPLSKDWDGMETFRRQKWLGIAKRYPTMTAAEQTRLQERMAAWARLSPEERIKARDKFKKLQKASPEQRDALKQKWQEYEKLPPEEKRRMADLAKARAAAQKKPRPAKPSSKFVKPQPTATGASSPPAAPIVPGSTPPGAAVPAETTAPAPAAEAPR